MTPTPDLPSGPKDIQVTTTTATDSKGVTGTAYNITDNGFPTGYLNNGKEINEANITELLSKAKEIWPKDMPWTTPGAADNNWYANPGSVAKSIPNLYGKDGNYACSGFAMMLSDYLFGKNSNPWTKVTNFADLRPGDIIITLNADKTPHHAMIVIGRFDNSRVFVAEGNAGNMVDWPRGTGKWYAIAEPSSYVAYTRWPQ